MTRIKPHDHFGIGVAIFQLLFMGRHPYAGQQPGSDLSLAEMVARNLFAYSKRRQTGVTPPGVLPSLDDFPVDITDGFERAFGLEPARRPSATEWVDLLQRLESGLSRCANDGMHYYPVAAKTCPWCRMEGATGAFLFLSPLVAKAAVATGLGNFDVEKAWQAIKGLILPDPNAVTPKLSFFQPAVSLEAKAAKVGSLRHKLIGVGIIAGAAIMAWVNVAYLPLLGIGFLIFAVVYFERTSVYQNGWRARYDTADTTWNEAVALWRNSLGIAATIRLRDDIEAAVNEYRGLPAAKAQAIVQLKNQRHARQLNDFLDRFLIRQASISGIGPAKTTSLEWFGIESAADIQRDAILAISGFGPVTADKLMAWRKQHERLFVYNPAPNQSDLAAQAKLDANFASKAAALAKKISGGQAELFRATSTLHQRLQSENARLSELAAARAQLEADLAFLGISKR